MKGNILSIVETAYRATLAEHNDTVLWLNAMLCDHGLPCNLLLRGNAVNYAIADHNSNIFLKNKNMSFYLEITPCLQLFMNRKMRVYVAEEDCEIRGINCGHQLLDGIEPVTQREIIKLVHKSSQVWYW